MSQELALKFSSAPIEQLLSVLPPEEVIEVLQERLRPDLECEIRSEYEERVDNAEEEACDAENRASSWECTANSLFLAIEKAVELPWTEALPILREALEENRADVGE